MAGRRLATALSEWRRLIGDEHVVTDEASREAAATATFRTHQGVPAILFPASREEVQGCLRVAFERRCPLYPVSRGRNWGYGSRVPVRDGCVVLDLSRLDRILDFDAQLAHVTVEPGVTFGQLLAFLEAQGAPLFASVPGSGPGASVVGNALERGDGSGPLGDRFAHVCGLEVVLPTGRCIHTGFARFGGAHAAPVARWGVGPSLDGLFSQSSFGVVTRMTVWLTPAPRHFQLVFVAVHDRARLPGLVDGLQRLRLEGTLRSPFALWNGHKAISLVQGYPWEAAGGATPLPQAVLDAALAGMGFGCWNSALALYGASRAQGEADRARVEEVLRGCADELRFDDHAGAIPWSDLAARGPLLGVPHERSLAGMYWRKPAVPPRIAPEADGCGFLWCTPAVPFTGAHVARATAICEAVIAEHGFEPQVALVCITERLINLAASIAYDREVAGEDERARACHDALLARLVAAGYPPFRLGLQSMNAPLGNADDDTAELLRALKQLVDPRHILAPGRYEP